MRALFLSGASAADGEGGRADVESNRPSSGHVGVVGAGQRRTEAYCAGATGNGTEQSGLHGREGESRRRVKRMGRPTDRPIYPLRPKEGTKRNRDLRERQRPDSEEESRRTREQSHTDEELAHTVVQHVWRESLIRHPFGLKVQIKSEEDISTIQY